MSPRFEQYPPRYRGSPDERRRDGYGRGSDWAPDQPRSGIKEPARDYNKDRDHGRPAPPHGAHNSSSTAPKANNSSLPPKANSVAGSSRSSSPPRSSLIPPADGEKAVQDIAKIFRDYGELTAERSNLKLQYNCIERAVKRRKTEYEKSRERHPEFPSVPEIQNKFRDGQSKELKRIQELQRSHDAKYQAATDGIASHVLSALPTLVRRKEAETLGSRDLKFECSSLKNQLHQLKENTKTQMSQMQSRWEEQMESSLASQRQAFNQQMGQLRKDMESERAKSDRLQRQELSFQLEHAWDKSAQAKASADELSALRAQVRGLESERSALSERVESLAQELARRQDDVQTLRESVAQCAATANDAQSTLRDVDLGAVDQIAEIFLGDWPKLQSKVEDHGRRLEELSGNQQAALGSASGGGGDGGTRPSGSLTLEQLRLAQDKMGEMWGSMLDEMSRTLSGLASRTDVLENVAAKTTEPIKATTDKHGEDVSRLIDKVVGLSDELDRKCEYLSHQFTTLDSQYNNLSTKALAEQIIAQLEGFYPRNGQIVAEISSLTNLLHDLTKRMDARDDEIRALRQMFNEMTAIFENIFPQSSLNGNNKRRRIDAGPDDQDPALATAAAATAATKSPAGTLFSQLNGANGTRQAPEP